MATRASTLKVISPAPREVWQELFDGDVEAIPYQHPAWFDSICQSGNYADASRLYETSDGRQFILPLVRRQGLPEILSPAASLPNGWGMGGLIGSAHVRESDISAVFSDLASLPYPRISVRPNPRLGDKWAVAAPKEVISVHRRAHVLDLDGGFEKVWEERFDKGTRKAVRKAERDGVVVVECDSTGRLIPVFHNLLKHSLNRWARQQNEPRFLAHWRGRNRDPLHKFQMIAKQMGEACRVWVAWVDGKPAAAILVLQHGNVNDARAVMDKELAAPTRANDLLLKLAIEGACQAGCRYYHLGESGNSASLAQFKERFGATPYTYAEYHIERFPITAIERGLKAIVKRFLGFKDA
jgi:CelD/BcsL family acetyltransferase involved in cellulose biosynthesis